jgi:hypothetical protein
VRLRRDVALLVALGSVLATGAAAASVPAPGTIDTVAAVGHPRGLALLPGGSLLVAEPFLARVQRLDPDGTLTTVAGDGAPGFSGDGSLATEAKLDQPHGVALEPDGGFVIADALNNRIRRVRPDGTITTVVGTGEDAYAGDDGPAVAAAIGAPRGLATLSDGTILIADTDNNRIRRVSPGGTITTVAGSGVAGFAGDGGPATLAQLSKPFGVAPLPAGGYLLADTGNDRIRKVAPDGTITTVAGDGVAGFGGDGGPGTAAELDHPHAAVPLPSGGFLVADTENHRVRRVWPDGTITTAAGVGTPGYSGDGGPAVSAQLDEPKALALEPGGKVLIGDSSNDRVRELRFPAVPPPRVVALRALRRRGLVDVRFRVCDGSRDELLAEFLVVRPRPERRTLRALASTRGGCRSFRLAAAAPGSSLARLRVRDDQKRWSNVVARVLR